MEWIGAALVVIILLLLAIRQHQKEDRLKKNYEEHRKKYPNPPFEGTHEEWLDWRKFEGTEAQWRAQWNAKQRKPEP